MGHRKRYYTHPKFPSSWDIADDDAAATAAARHAFVTDGARGHRVLIQQDPQHPANFERDGTQKTKYGIPLTRAFASDEAFAAALTSVQGQPWHYTTFCTFAVATANRGELWCSRTEDNIEHLLANMIDVDWHMHATASGQFADAEAVWAHVQETADKLGWPPLNRVHFTGRGLLVGYQYRSIPAFFRDPTTKAISKTRQASLGHWRMLQTYMYHRLSHLTSDRSTLQPGHFFKTLGSPNPKSGRTVRLGREPEGGVYCFRLVFNQLAPQIRAAYMAGELDSYSVDWPKGWREARIQAQIAAQPLETNVVSLGAARMFSGVPSRKIKRDGTPKKVVTPDLIGEIIWSRRVVALVSYYKALLAEGRAAGELRQRLLFLAAVGLSWTCPALWRQEFLRIIMPLVDFREKEAMARVCTVIKRADEFLRGETRMYAEVEVDPRYRFQNETIRSGAWLDLSDDDIRSYPMLSVFADAELQKELHQDRQNERRRTKGRSDRGGRKTTGMDRETWLAAARADAPHVQSLRAKGMSIRDIVAETGIKKCRVETLLTVDTSTIKQVDEAKVSAAAASRAAQAAAAPKASPQAEAAEHDRLHILPSKPAAKPAAKTASSPERPTVFYKWPPVRRTTAA